MYDQSEIAGGPAAVARKDYRAKGCRDVDPQFVARLRAMVTRRTDEALADRFGISYNTWRKLIAGEPVRASLLTRLEARIESLEAEAARG